MGKIFSWDISCNCNFNCHYCFISKEGAGRQELKNLDGIITGWKYVYDCCGACKIYITGGEPFIYPGFVDIVEGLAKFHIMHITTNLSVPVDDFIERISPQKVEFNCTFHPMYISPDSFIKQTKKLKLAGFTCGVCYLAHPLQMREMLNYKKIFRKNNIDMALNEFWGNYNGKNYPLEYTEEEKEYYNYVVSWKPDTIEFQGARNGTGNIEQLYNLKPPVTNSRLCKAGYNYAAIDAEGNVKRCGQDPSSVMGNIFEKNLVLLNEPEECSVEYCRSREFNYTSQ
ncbi:radical SAM protein [Elusimicrobiota bacterium]